MKCQCEKEMDSICFELDGRENPIGQYYHCSYCGRLFFEKDPSYRHKSFWVTPKYLQELDYGK